MFKNQVVNRQPTNTFIRGAVLTSANRQPAKEVRRAKLLPWLRFKLEVTELYANQRTAATRHLFHSACVCVCGSRGPCPAHEADLLWPQPSLETQGGSGRDRLRRSLCRMCSIHALKSGILYFATWRLYSKVLSTSSERLGGILHQSVKVIPAPTRLRHLTTVLPLARYYI